VCNCPFRLSQATRNGIVHATPSRKTFRPRKFLRKYRHHAEMPMNEGFLHRHNFCPGEKARRDSDILRETFSRTTTPAQSTPRRKKNFAPNAFMDVLKGLARRKTRESVPSDSRRRHVCRPRAATLHGGFRFHFDSRSAREVLARMGRRQRHSTALRCRSSSSGDR
jgi:hypothetical protein